MITLLLAATMTCNNVPIRDCSVPEFITTMDNEFTNEDCTILRGAYHGCRKHYGQQSCLSKLTKTGPHAFRIICTSPVLRDK